ncbi:MAG: Tfp pilus assembly protein FimT/FimU [Alphaproteobacteria bacterium]
MFDYLNTKNKLVSAGRSMIEMLGVLAIIGVLSVGGIAGYSKAMTKYKVNRTIDEYMHLFRGLIEYEDSLKKLPGAEIDGAGPGLADFVLAANLVPETWKKKSGDYYLIDSNGFNVRTLLSNNRYLMELYLEVYQKDGYATRSFSGQLCTAMFRDVFKPLQDTMFNAWVRASKGTAVKYYGEKFCHKSGRQCLSSLTLADINAACDGCKGSAGCYINIEF